MNDLPPFPLLGRGLIANECLVAKAGNTDTANRRDKGKVRVMELIIQLIAGALGGNVAGAALKNLSLGTLGNSIVGVLGGGLGGQILGMLGAGGVAAGTAAAGGMDIGSIIGSLASGGVGGGVLMAIVGVLKNVLAKK